MSDQRTNRENLEAGLEGLGLALDSNQIEALAGYHDFLMETNASLNLTGHKTHELSLVNNLLNALGPWRQIHPTKTSADIGTGGGFPGIPLAIALGMGKLTLIESKQKKCRFLEEACQRFAPEVKVRCDDGNIVREKFQQVMFCGFGTLKKILGVSRACLHPKGRVLAWKGSKERTLIEVEECGIAQQKWELIPFKVPGLDAERHLAVWKRGE
ncbi:MAG: 16S rRNA (guanine(527)-N(7))-methyltransferase RsmG [Planctomycetes bacterium]|nr:16S rRNA (guanine(527)-N(7))-methyltransferase RsmG [Planctomycetota bacterium]